MADEQVFDAQESDTASSERGESEQAAAIFGALTGSLEKPDHPEGADKETPGDEGKPETSASPADSTKPEESTDNEAALEQDIRAEGYKASLRRAGLNDELISRMTPAEIQRLGEHQRKIQSDFDRISSERGELQRQLEQLDDEEMTAEDFEDPDLRRLAEVDLDAAKNIHKKLLDQEQQSQEREVRQAMETAYSMLDDLAEDYPQLQDPSTRQKVLRTATALSQAGAFEDMVAGEDLMETALSRACSLLFKDKNKTTAQVQLMERADRQRDGQVDDGGAGGTDAIDDPDKWAYDTLRDPNNTLTPQQIAEKREKLLREGKAKRPKTELISL